MNQYTFTRLIDGELYSGRVPAESWESAQSSLSDGVIDGMLVESRCSECLSVLDDVDVIDAEFIG